MSDQPRAEGGPDQPADSGQKPDQAPTTAFSWEPAEATRVDPAAGSPGPVGSDGGELPPPPPPRLRAEPTQVMGGPYAPPPAGDYPPPPAQSSASPPPAPGDASAAPEQPSYAEPSYAEPSYAQPDYSRPSPPQYPSAPPAPPPAGQPQAGLPQPAYPAPGYAQSTYPAPGYAQPAYPAPGYPQPGGYGPPPGYAAPPPLTPEAEDVRGKAVLWTILNGLAIFYCGNLGAIVGVILAAVAIGRARTDLPGARRFVKLSWIWFIIGFALVVVFVTLYVILLVGLAITSA
ncbi:MAG: hypothetical protein ACFCUP_12625 [Actinomycetales bacterium]